MRRNKRARLVHGAGNLLGGLGLCIFFIGAASEPLELSGFWLIFGMLAAGAGMMALGEALMRCAEEAGSFSPSTRCAGSSLHRGSQGTEWGERYGSM